VRASSAGQELSEWEQVVADAWRQVLSLDDVGLDDDFFELGGDSLAAETLMASMLADLGVPPEAATTSALVQAPTVRELARRLARRPASHETMIPLRETGSRPPLFVCAGGGGLGVAFVALARHLGDDRPVYAFQARGMERRGVPDFSVRAMAKRNVASLLTVQPSGPFHLAGHSFGGLVALEMAHRLRRAGHEVALVAFLDSFPPDPSIHPSGHRPLKRRLKDALGVVTTGVRGGPGLDQYWRFYRLSEVLHRRYRTSPYAGEALVVVADSPERALRAGWEGHLTGSWRLVDVEGDHLSMVREPYVAGLAKVLDEALWAVQPASENVR
jgi:thioesterase domain-containing protein